MRGQCTAKCTVSSADTHNVHWFSKLSTQGEAMDYLQMSSIIKCFIQVASKKHVYSLTKTCSARFSNCCFLAVIEYLAIEEKFLFVKEVNVMFTLMSDIAPLEAILRMQHKIETTKLYLISLLEMFQPSRGRLQWV